jgi:hypothetical protein
VGTQPGGEIGAGLASVMVVDTVSGLLCAIRLIKVEVVFVTVFTPIAGDSDLYG